jgi:hypothetical protein
MSKNVKVKELNAVCVQHKVNLNFKPRKLKKDPLQYGRADIANGAVYFEFVEGAERPNGGFIVLTLGGLYDNPNAESKEIEQFFVNLGFHETLNQLVTALISTLKTLNGLSTITN